MSAIDDLAAQQEQRANGRPASSDDAARGLAEIMRLPTVDRSIRGARIVGRGAAASADLFLDDGTTITFATLQDFTTPKRLAVEVASCTGAPMPVLDMPTALRALVLLRTIAEHVEATTADDVAIGWGLAYLQSVDKTIAVDMNDRGQRWGAFEHLSRKQRDVVLEHVDGTRFVRTGWFFDYARRADKAPGGNAAIANRMERVGWVRRGKQGRIKATRKAPADQLVFSFFEVPAGWEALQADDDLGTKKDAR